MALYKHPNSPYWYYSFTFNGRRIQGSTKTKSKSLAEEIYLTRRVDSLRGEHKIRKPKRISFKKLTDEYLEWSKANKKSYQRDVYFVMHLTGFFKRRDLCDITSLDVEKYKMKRLKQVSPATVNKEVASLRRMFNLAMSWGIADENPVKGVKFLREQKCSFRWWTREEIRRFLDACDERMKAIGLIGINTGMRISEILNLRWKDIDFANKYITVEESKSGTYRKVKMSPIVIESLESVERESEYVFSNGDGKPFKRVIKGFKNTCRRAGIKDSTPMS